MCTLVKSGLNEIDPPELEREERIPNNIMKDTHPSVDDQNGSSGKHQDVRFFENIFRTYFSPLCKVVFKLVKDREASEDIVQDVFMKLWNRRNDLQLNTSIKSYLYKAAINTALNHIKTQKKSTKVEDFEDGAMELVSVGTEEILSFKEVQEKLAKSLDKLPPKCKAIFILIKYEDMSYAEASQALEISVKTVENQMGKALKHMRTEMQEYLGYLLSLFIILLNKL